MEVDDCARRLRALRLRPLCSVEQMRQANPALTLRRAMRWDCIRHAPMSRAQIRAALRQSQTGVAS